MSEQTPAWDPPLTGTDAVQIAAALDRRRSTGSARPSGGRPTASTRPASPSASASPN